MKNKSTFLKPLFFALSFTLFTACGGGGGGSNPPPAPKDTTAPTISSISPANNAISISLKPSISLTFSEAVTGVTAANVLLSKTNTGASPITLTVSGSGNSYSFKPSANLEYNTQYFVVIKAAQIKDAANNALGKDNKVVSFTTQKQPLRFSAWVGNTDTLLDISAPNGSELYSYRGASYGACDISNITGCDTGKKLLLNGSTTTNTAHTLANSAFYKLKEGSQVSTNSKEISAPFAGRSGHEVVFFKNKLWVIGGQSGSAYKNDIWSSDDGKSWTQVSVTGTQFSGRAYHQVVKSNIGGSEKLWLIGGFDGTNSKNDVWSSTDGATWTQSTLSGTPFSARLGHGLVAADIDGSEKLWLIGGSDGDKYKNDVWSSTDGATWTQSTLSGTPFSARNSHQVVVANIDGNKKLWLIGGFDGSSQSLGRLNDVWSSANGSAWTKVKADKKNPDPAVDKQFVPRSNHQVVASGSKLWVIGGFGGSYTSRNNLNDVWSSSDGVNWTKTTISGKHFSARNSHQVVQANIGGTQRFYVIGGSAERSDQNDVWRSENATFTEWRKAYFGEITRP